MRATREHEGQRQAHRQGIGQQRRSEELGAGDADAATSEMPARGRPSTALRAPVSARTERSSRHPARRARRWHGVDPPRNAPAKCRHRPRTRTRQVERQDGDAWNLAGKWRPDSIGLELPGDAWSLLIVRDLMFKDRRTCNDFLAACEGIASNVLADRLRKLEEANIIEKRRDLGRRAAPSVSSFAQGHRPCTCAG